MGGCCHLGSQRIDSVSTPGTKPPAPSPLEHKSTGSYENKESSLLTFGSLQDG